MWSEGDWSRGAPASGRRRGRGGADWGRLTSGPLPAGIVALAAAVACVDYGPSLFGLGGLTDAAEDNLVLLGIAGPTIAAALLTAAALAGRTAVLVDDRDGRDLSAQSRAGLLISGLLLLVGPVWIYLGTRDYPMSVDASVLAALTLLTVGIGWFCGLLIARRPALTGALVAGVLGVWTTVVVWAVMAWLLMPDLDDEPLFILPSKDLVHGLVMLHRWEPVARGVCLAVAVVVAARLGPRRDRFTAAAAAAGGSLIGWVFGVIVVLPVARGNVTANLNAVSAGLAVFGALLGGVVAAALFRPRKKRSAYYG